MEKWIYFYANSVVNSNPFLKTSNKNLSCIAAQLTIEFKVRTGRVWSALPLIKQEVITWAFLDISKCFCIIRYSSVRLDLFGEQHIWNIFLWVSWGAWSVVIVPWRTKHTKKLWRFNLQPTSLPSKVNLPTKLMTQKWKEAVQLSRSHSVAQIVVSHSPQQAS